MKLTQLLEKATDDIQKAEKARSIIRYIKTQISNYKGNNSVIKISNDKIVINYQYLIINLHFNQNTNGINAEYDPINNTINVYNVKIFKNPLKVIFNENILFHELIHYFDIHNQYKGDIKKDVEKYEKTSKTNYDAYLNHPLEVNAHFFENIFPGILDGVKNNTNLVNISFKDFYSNLFKSNNFAEFFNDLNDKNKRKIQKRIAAIYLELKNNPEELKQLVNNININNLEIERKKYTWLQKLWDKLGDY